jgi:hypothetical protein
VLCTAQEACLQLLFWFIENKSLDLWVGGGWVGDTLLCFAFALLCLLDGHATRMCTTDTGKVCVSGFNPRQPTMCSCFSSIANTAADFVLLFASQPL